MRRACFRSRKLERATYDSVAFRFIAANKNGRNSVRRPRQASLTDRNYEVSADPETCGPSRVKGVLYR